MTGSNSWSRWRILWSFARPHRGALALALVLGLVVSATELANPLATKWILDELAVGGSILWPILLLVGLLIAGTAVSWWQWVLLGTFAEAIVFDARAEMIGRMIRARVLPLLQRPRGDLLTRVTSDTVLLREAASSSLVGLVNGFIMLAGTLTLMFVLDTPLTVAAVTAVVIIGAIFAVLVPAIGRLQEWAQASLGRLGTELDGTLRAIKTVKVAGAEERRIDRVIEHAVEARDHSIAAVRREALAWSIGLAGMQAAIIVILGFGAWRVAEGAITVSTLIAFLLYAFGLLGPVTELAQHLTTLQAGIAAAGRVRDIRALPVEAITPDAAPASEDRDDREPAVQFRGVSARYTPDGPIVVDGLSLTVPARGHTAIVGPSGAGKTTVLSLILQFLEPAEGTILLGGTASTTLGPSGVRRRLAYVEQETPLIPGTLRENLAFSAPEATESQMRAVLHDLRLDDFLFGLPAGLDSTLDDTGISGGQRQRIGLARALLRRPDVLLLDEVTAQVDGISERAVHRVIRQHTAHRAAITIAHRLSTVVDADQIIVMDAGRAVAAGTHQRLLDDSPLYRELVRSLRIPESVDR